MNSHKALQWLAEVLAVDGHTLTPADTRLSVPEWDSLGSLLLLARLEEDLGIILSADQLATMNTVQEICELLAKNNAFVE